MCSSDLEKIAKWAGQHHERLDGSGYCRGTGQSNLDLGSRVLAVADVAIAMAERRPYREPHDAATVQRELAALAGQGWLDAKVVAALADNHPAIAARVAAAQTADAARYRKHYAMIS